MSSFRGARCGNISDRSLRMVIALLSADVDTVLILLIRRHARSDSGHRRNVA